MKVNLLELHFGGSHLENHPERIGRLGQGYLDAPDGDFYNQLLVKTFWRSSVVSNRVAREGIGIMYTLK